MGVGAHSVALLGVAVLSWVSGGVEAALPYQCGFFPCCFITSDEPCELDSLLPGTLVYPGGDAVCLSGTPYAFQVWPGDRDKLVLFFQGGGACFDNASTNAVPSCPTDVYPGNRYPSIDIGPFEGVFNRSDPRNPYRNHTFLHLLYCSGDGWAGNVMRPYNYTPSTPPPMGIPTGAPVQQKGLVNARATIEWVEAQLRNGSLSSPLSDLIVTGCSAGALGAQFWARTILARPSTISYSSAALLPDSYVGLFPFLIAGLNLLSLGFCDADLLPPALTSLCRIGLVGMREIGLENLRVLQPLGVPVAFIQSKLDGIQKEFYDAFSATFNPRAANITDTDFYAGVNRILRAYSRFPNFAAYLVDGSQHCFLNFELFYNTTARGPPVTSSSSQPPSLLRGGTSGSQKDASRSPLLLDWVKGLSGSVARPLLPAASEQQQQSRRPPSSSVCVGPFVPAWPLPPRYGLDNNTYCSQAIYYDREEEGQGGDGTVTAGRY